MEWMILPYWRYFEFSGRSRRREYWMFVLFGFLVGMLINAMFGTKATTTSWGYFSVSSSLDGGIGGVLLNVFSLLTLIPGLAVAVRRLHDQDRSGWLMLFGLIPFLGWFALLVLMCLEGTRGPNRFGSDPKGRIDPRDVFD